MDPLTRMQAHYLIKQVNELRISDPIIATEVETFFKDGDQATEPSSKQLVLLRHYLCIVTTSHAKQAHIDLTVALKREDAAL